MEQARTALLTYPEGLQIGGGVNAENAKQFIDMGASHVIVTSYVFRDGRIDFDRLDELVSEVGKTHLVLDLSCRRKQEDIDLKSQDVSLDKQGATNMTASAHSPYYIVTDRWQKFTDEPLSRDLLSRLSSYADEFLVHAVDVEGKASGVEKELVSLLAGCVEIPITYVGGVGSYEDIEVIRELGKGHVNVTIGSALDLFGGRLEFDKVLAMMD